MWSRLAATIAGAGVALLGVWRDLPPDVRRRIIDLLVDALEQIIRDYYKNWRESQEKA